MYSQLIRKLERFCALPSVDKEALLATIRRPLRNVSRGDDIITARQVADDIRILLSGWGFRYKRLSDGRRQILSVVLPADICELNVFSMVEMDHSIMAATPLVLGELPRPDLEALMADRPAIQRALSCDLQLSIGLLHESIVNIGQRNALERTANLFCEICVRLLLIGASESLNFYFPLTQADLAAMTGLSTVHVNRTLQELRRLKLISLSEKHLHVLDLDGLKSLALFDPAFLHLPRHSVLTDGGTAPPRTQSHSDAPSGDSPLLRDGACTRPALKVQASPIAAAHQPPG